MDAKKLITTTHPLLSDKVRLAIMATLASADKAVDFKTLIESLALSKGNLSSHMSKLEEAELVVVKKEFVGKLPRTTYRCSRKGRKEVLAYLKQVEQLLKGAMSK